MTFGDSAKKHRVVGSFTTNASAPGRESWDLRPYKTAGIGKTGGTWRLIEVGYNLLYAEGKIAADGTLVSYDYVEPAAPARSGTESGLDDTFYSHYSYDGYMELQVFDGKYHTAEIQSYIDAPGYVGLGGFLPKLFQIKVTAWCRCKCE